MIRRHAAYVFATMFMPDAVADAYDMPLLLIYAMPHAAAARVADAYADDYFGDNVCH